VPVVVLVLGCGPGRKPVHPVQGKVLVQGQPAARALVTFHPVDAAADTEVLRPVGQADEQGNFTLTTYRQGDGAPAGEYRVTVQWLLATPVNQQTRDEYVTVNYLPARYGQPASSGLAATVSPGNNQLPAFELSPR
jgi:hypothetical protein